MRHQQLNFAKAIIFPPKGEDFSTAWLTVNNGTTIGLTLTPDSAKHVRGVDFLLFMELRIWTQKSYYDRDFAAVFLPHFFFPCCPVCISTTPIERKASRQKTWGFLAREMSQQWEAFHSVTSPEGIFSYVTRSSCCCCEEGCCLPCCNWKKPSGRGWIQRRICKCADATLP